LGTIKDVSNYPTIYMYLLIFTRRMKLNARIEMNVQRTTEVVIRPVSILQEDIDVNAGLVLYSREVNARISMNASLIMEVVNRLDF